MTIRTAIRCDAHVGGQAHRSPCPVMAMFATTDAGVAVDMARQAGWVFASDGSARCPRHAADPDRAGSA